MRNKLLHPVWTHVPALALFLVLLITIFTFGPFPATVATHFGSNGTPNDYGSPWSAFGLIIAISVLFFGISVTIDELWARQEKQKIFNWFSLMDEIIIGAMAGMNLGYLAYLRSGDITYNFPWVYSGLMTGAAIILGVLAELARPYRPFAKHPEETDAVETNEDVIKHLQGNATFIYWDYQNPFYVTLVSIGVPLILLVSAVLSWFTLPLLAIILVVTGISFTIFYGGLRVLVTRDKITLRLGLLGIRVLQLKIADITGVETREFSPLKDFGGYGIRANSEMSAYYLSGTTGVKLTTTSGKKYLIGSDNPARLANVINAVSSLQKRTV